MPSSRTTVSIASSVARVGAYDTGEIADTHVVGDDGEIVTAQDLLRFHQVPHGASERLLRIEACIDASTHGAKSISLCLVATTDRLLQQVGAARLFEIDGHPEKVCRGLSEDLGETGRVLGVVAAITS